MVTVTDSDGGVGYGESTAVPATMPVIGALARQLLGVDPLPREAALGPLRRGLVFLTRFAGTGTLEGHAMFKSFDGGKHWTKERDVVTVTDPCFNVDPIEGRCVMDGYAGARIDLSAAPSVDIASARIGPPCPRNCASAGARQRGDPIRMAQEIRKVRMRRIGGVLSASYDW